MGIRGAHICLCKAHSICGLKKRHLFLILQELLQDPFLHPNRARVPPPQPSQPMGALSEDQLRQLIAEVARAGATGPADIDKLTRQLMNQLTTTSAAAGGGGGTTGTDTRDTTGMSTSSSIDSGIAAAAVAATAAATGRGQQQQVSSSSRHPLQQQHPDASQQPAGRPAQSASLGSCRGQQPDPGAPATAAAVSTASAARGISSRTGTTSSSSAAAGAVARAHASAGVRVQPSMSSRHTTSGTTAGHQPDAAAARR